MIKGSYRWLIYMDSGFYVTEDRVYHH
uniref:Uncharacterized protein n=1 Tax=Arundo donax TaxID=35708 RepID=A0A0A8ZBP6_ARUDO